MLSAGRKSTAEWARKMNGGGVDVVVSCPGPGSPGSSSVYALRNGGFTNFVVVP